MRKKYIVRLLDEKKEILENVIKKLKGSSFVIETVLGMFGSRYRLERDTPSTSKRSSLTKVARRRCRECSINCVKASKLVT